MATLEEDEDYNGEECEGKRKLEVKAHQASHTKYLMMRGYCCPGIGSVCVKLFVLTGEGQNHYITKQHMFLSSQTT